MKKLFSNVKNGCSLLHCAFILEWRGLAITSMSWLRPERFHKFVNYHTLRGAKKILQVVKANYAIEYEDPKAISPSKPYIFISNHQSLFDVPLIFATIPGTIRMVSKAELFRIPILGHALRKSGCIPIDRKNVSYENFLQNVKAALRKGISIWFFPEGTRSRTGELLSFKTGAFRIASETNTEIVPVGISNTRTIMPPNSLRVTYNQDVKIRIGAPVSLEHFNDEESLKLNVLKLRNIIKQLINQ